MKKKKRKKDAEEQTPQQAPPAPGTSCATFVLRLSFIIHKAKAVFPRQSSEIGFLHLLVLFHVVYW